MPWRPELPLILVSEDGVELFGSLDRLTGYVEGIDVADGLHRAFDAFGREIELRAHGVGRAGRVADIGTVTAALPDPPALRPEIPQAALRTALAALSRRGVDDVEGLDGDDLPELVARVARIVGPAR